MQVIDFYEKKRKKEAALDRKLHGKLLMQYQKTGKVEYLHKLVAAKRLNFEAHQLLLAHVMAMESHDVKAEEAYRDAIWMMREQFHGKYPFDWWISVQSALTFLAIQKETNLEAYERYIEILTKK